MGVVAYPQDIPYLDILECKPARGIHPGRQTAKCRIAEYESEGYATYGGDICPVQGSALPMVISLRI